MIALTQRAQSRLLVLSALDRREVRMADAAQLLGLSVRHLRRLHARYRIQGASALVHGNRGRSSPRRLSEPLRRRLVRLAQTRYTGVNFQHFTDLLAEREHIHVSRTSLRRILTAAGLRSPRTRRPPRHRRRRERMPQAGMLVQMDGSHHPWLEARGPRLVPHAALDDATGRVLGGVFRPQEDASGYLLLLRSFTATYGLPLAVYTDRHGLFHRDPRAPLTLVEQLQGLRPSTHVGRALQALGIRWIPAASPQAKGRIERLFGTLQERLVTALRLAGIQDCAGANALLPRFLRRFNARFTQPPANPTSAYRPWPAELDPDAVFCFTYPRTVGNDNTISLGPTCVQLHPGPKGRSYAKARVEVREHLNGSITVVYKNQVLPATVTSTISQKDQRLIPLRHHERRRTLGALRRKPRSLPQPQLPSPSKPRVIPKPGPDHPWGRMPVGKAQRLPHRTQGTISLAR
jgi:transposase